MCSGTTSVGSATMPSGKIGKLSTIGPATLPSVRSGCMASTSIVWLRRDLRIHDHPALSAAAGEDERVLLLYVLDERMIGGRFASGPRYAFLLGCLRELDAELKARGAGLCVVAGRPEEVVPSIALEVGAQAVHWTRTSRRSRCAATDA